MKKAMVRKQIYLDADQEKQLRRVAKRLRCSEAQILREALDRHLGLTPKRVDAPENDSIWTMVGAWSSDTGDLSERVDAILYDSEST
jgi:hypothetical protein